MTIQPDLSWQLSKCRVCESPVKPLLDLGISPIANHLLSHADESAPAYPLGLCECPNCGLVQNSTLLATKELFGESYPYLSSTSSAVRAHFADLAKELAAVKGAGTRALEIGSNDGTLQLALKDEGVHCVGVDPATPAVELALKAGCESYNMAFDEVAAEHLLGRVEPVDIAVMCNVIAHVPQPGKVLGLAAQFLKPGGVLVAEAQSWEALASQAAFDMVYHEHHSHYSAASFTAMANRAGLGVTRIDAIDTQGGSLRFWCERDVANSAEVEAFLAAEAVRLADAGAKLNAAGDGVREATKAFALENADKRVAGYGAAAKTVTILSVADGALAPAYVADASPTKSGKRLPNGQTPIVTPQELLADNPDVVILFAWNLAKEILPHLKGLEVWSPIPTLHRIQ